MAKDSTRVPTPEIEAGALVEDGGATTQGKGGYMSGQGLDPAGDVVTTDGTDPGSST